MTLKRFPWLIDGEAYDREAKHFAYPVFSMSVDFIRSEERRVGKEC